MKTILLTIALAIAILFSGCTKNKDGVMVGKYTGIEYSSENIQESLDNARIIYHDATHIVFEVETEIQRVNSEGFGKEK